MTIIENGKIKNLTGTPNSPEDAALVAQNGTTTPAVTPRYIGDIYVDTVLDVSYIGVGIASPSDWVATGGSAAVAWGDITGTLADQTDLQAALDAKQALLVSATNIKTINGASLLGSGDLSVTASNPSYTPGSFTVSDGTYKPLGKRMQLTSSQRAQVSGTGRLRVSN